MVGLNDNNWTVQPITAPEGARSDTDRVGDVFRGVFCDEHQLHSFAIDCHVARLSTKKLPRESMKTHKIARGFFRRIFSWIKKLFRKVDPLWRQQKYHHTCNSIRSSLENTIYKASSVAGDSVAYTYSEEMREQFGNLIDIAQGDARRYRPQKTEYEKIGEYRVKVCEYHTLEALRFLYRHSDNPRQSYKKFVVKLRKALSTEHYKSSCATETDHLTALLNSISFAIFTGVEARQFGDDLTGEIARAGGYSPLADEEGGGRFLAIEQRLGILARVYKCIRNADMTHKVHPLTGLGMSIAGNVALFNLDPILHGNSPTKKFDVITKGGKTVVNLRLPTPTLRGRITPEFKAYLRAVKARGRKHTYINFQRRVGSIFNGESQRSASIHNLSMDPEFSEMFTVITLDKNSPFYKQSHEFAGIKNAKEFIDTFMARIDEGNSGFLIPERFARNDLKARLVDIHLQLFSGKAMLSREERQDFIEVAYTMLIDHFVAETSADYYNASCKDCIDRGGGANALMFYVMTLRESGALTPQAFKQRIDAFGGMIFADALWARKRAIRHERLDRAVSAAQRTVQRAESNETFLLWLETQMYFSRIK